MSKDALHERGRALEDLFFAKHDQELIEQLRAKEAAEHTIAELSEQTGVHDHDVLARMVALGVGTETLSAFSVVPLLVVAWGDQVLDNAERDAVLTEAVDAGLVRDGAAYQLLSSWLTRAPNKELVDAWISYHQHLASHLTAEEKTALKAGILTRAQRVARASGGFLGFGAVSNEEQTALDKLEAVLSA